MAHHGEVQGARRSGWRRLLPVAVVVGVGPWGGLAGGWLFGAIAIALGAPRSVESWGLWAALVGFTLGFGASSYGVMRLVDRWPRTLGLAAGVLATLAVVTTLAEPYGWDWLYLMLPGAALAALAVRYARRR
jgi:hypothetical protein